MPLAWLVARTDIPARRTIRILMTASFVTPPFLGAIAWEILAAPNSGILNRLWRDLAGAETALFNIYSLPGLIFVIACYTTPFVFVLLANALDRIPAELEDAAAILGAPPLRILRDVTLPLVLPAILAGALIAFLQAMVLFGSPAILALPAGLSHDHDQDLHAVPISAQAASRGGGGPAASGRHRAAAVGTAAR